MLKFSNSKINIGLNIVSKREDSYHNIESLFYPIQYCDIIEILNSSKFELINLGIKIDCSVEENLCYKAFLLMSERYNIAPVKILLYKRIAFGTGLGAGSANAAYTIKMLNEMNNLQLSIEEMQELAFCIGSDVGFFIENKPSFVTGRGEILKSFDINLDRYKIVLALSPLKVSTKKAYSAIKIRKEMISLEEKLKMPIKEWRNNITNDFEDYVFALYPELREIKEKFYENGAIYSQMSGTGSAIFAIFEDIPKNLSLSNAELVFCKN